MNKLISFFCFLLLTITISAQSITHGPVTGAVTQSSAKVTYFADQQLAAQLRYSKQANFAQYDSVSATTDQANGFILKFRLSDLESNMQYYHRLYLNGNPAADVGTFRTKPCDGESGIYSFHLGSCQNENRNNDEVFQEMLNHPADFFLQIGDWGYPDDTDNLPNNNDFFPADYNRLIDAYKNKYDYQNMQEYLKTTWVDYVWDDHDYVDNNSSENTSSYTDFGVPPVLTEIPFPPGTRRNALRGYYDLFPAFEPVDSSEGIYHKFRYGNIEVFMLDNRASRSPVNDAIQEINGDYVYAPPAGHSILGDEQREWLLENLKKSTATWKFITTATAFNITYRDAIQGVLNLPNLAGLPLASALVDSWSGYPMDQDSIMNLITREKIDGVIMMSGDTHTTGIDDGQAGGITEIMAGCLSQTNSALFTTAPLLNFGLIWSEGGQGIGGNTNTNDSFGKVSINGDNSVTLEVIDENGNTITDYTQYSCSYYSGLDLQVQNTTPVQCYGDSNGFVRVAATGGVPPYSYTIDPEREVYKFNPVFSDLSAGKYTIAVKDVSGCTKEICVTVEQPDSIQLETITENVKCNGAASGSAEILASGGNGGFNYQWPGNVNGNRIASNLSAGTYQVTVADNKQCSNTVSVEISEPASITYNSILEDVNCNGANDGIATIQASGGVQPYSIAWEDSVTTFTNNQLSYGYNTFVIADSNSCTLTDSVFIDQPDTLLINPIITADSSNNEGAIVLNPQGGTPPYLYQWQGPSRSDTLQNLSAGNYSVRVIDANGCLLKTSVEVPFVVDSNSVGVSQNTFDQYLKIYPNPARESVLIEWSGPQKVLSIQILDVKGKAIWSQAFNKQMNQLKIDLTEWSAGVYFVRINLDVSRVTKRLVVQD